jgi:hypothetical protein
MAGASSMQATAEPTSLSADSTPCDGRQTSSSVQPHRTFRTKQATTKERPVEPITTNERVLYAIDFLNLPPLLALILIFVLFVLPGIMVKVMVAGAVVLLLGGGIHYGATRLHAG